MCPRLLEIMALTCFTPIRESLVPAAITPRLQFVTTVRGFGSRVRKPEWAHRGFHLEYGRVLSLELQGRVGGFRLPVRARFATLEHQHLVSIQMLAFGYYKNKCFSFLVC
jgi:hypothetical protein